MALRVEDVASTRARLWDAGFRPIAVLNGDHPDPKVAGKAPIGRDWGKRARQDPPEAVVMQPVKHALNTGILCDGLRAIDIDVDDPEIASRCRSLVVGRFGEAPIRMRRNSSRCLVLYRATSGEPPKIVLAGTHGKIEVLGKGQQFVAFGTHPSGADLEWFPDAPGQESIANIPAISEEDIADMLADAAGIIGATELPRVNGHDHAAGEPQADPLRVAAALNDIPNTGPKNWDSWNRIGMAAWRATGGSELGFAAFDAWSSRHPAYDPAETRERWNHYPTSPPTEIGAGTLFRLAKEAKPRMADEPQATATDAPQKPPVKSLPLVYFSEIEPNIDAADFVEGLLIEGSMSVVYGESNCGKTFFMTDLGLHIALGRSWRGREVEVGGVIYCALEGSHGISNRVAAFRTHHNLAGEDLPFAVVPYSVNMLDPEGDTESLIQTIREAAEHMRAPVRLVVIDTLSRALAGGNENAPDDMGALVTNTDRVRQSTSAAVAYIHHSGKDAAKGARGHSLLRAATDTEIEVSRPDSSAPSVARVTKQREMEIEGEFPFKLETVTLGTNKRGKPVTSCVVVEAEAVKDTGRETFGGKLPANAELGLRALKAVLSKSAAKLPPGPDYPSDTWAVAAGAWREEFYQLKSGSPDTNKHAFSNAETSLLSRNVITARNGLVWLVRSGKGDSNGL